MRWHRKYADMTEWHDWFAWHPVILVSRERVWLEVVHRRSVSTMMGAFWEYTDV